MNIKGTMQLLKNKEVFNHHYTKIHSLISYHMNIANDVIGEGMGINYIRIKAWKDQTKSIIGGG